VKKSVAHKPWPIPKTAAHAGTFRGATSIASARNSGNNVALSRPIDSNPPAKSGGTRLTSTNAPHAGPSRRNRIGERKGEEDAEGVQRVERIVRHDLHEWLVAHVVEGGDDRSEALVRPSPRFVTACPGEPDAGQSVEIRRKEQHADPGHRSREQPPAKRPHRRRHRTLGTSGVFGSSRILIDLLQRQHRERNADEAAVRPRESNEQSPERRGDPVAVEEVVTGGGGAKQEQRFGVRRIVEERERIGGKEKCGSGRALWPDQIGSQPCHVGQSPEKCAKRNDDARP